jgi:hypothetical protein
VWYSLSFTEQAVFFWCCHSIALLQPT